MEDGMTRISAALVLVTLASGGARADDYYVSVFSAESSPSVGSPPH
jgi:hypothetical protein